MPLTECRAHADWLNDKIR